MEPRSWRRLQTKGYFTTSKSFYSMIRIALVEDNAFARQALNDKLCSYTEIEIACTAQNGQEAIRCLEGTTAIDLVLMDIEMPVMDGIEATRIIKNKFPNIKIVIITIYDDDDFIFRAIQAGADSYILKEAKAEKIYETIQDTLRGGAVMSPSIAAKTIKLMKRTYDAGTTKAQNAIGISEREMEILQHLSQGQTNKKIAEALMISPFTVKRHIENIYKKLQASSRVELVQKAKREGLL